MLNRAFERHEQALSVDLLVAGVQAYVLEDSGSFVKRLVEASPTIM